MPGDQQDVVEGEGFRQAGGNLRRGSQGLSHVAPWHFLYFLPLPHQHGSLRPTFGSSRRTVFTTASSPPVRAGRGGLPAPVNGRAAVAVIAPAELDPPLSVIGDGLRATGLGG